MAKTFHCPSCLASLDHQHVDALAVKCPYCGTSVIVPETLRQKTKEPGNVFDVFTDQSLSGLVEVAQMARSGRKIDAVKRYRELFDVSLKEAKDAVDQMVGGGIVQLGTSSFGSSTVSSYSSAPTVQTSSGRGASCLIFLLVLGIGVAIAGYVILQPVPIQQVSEIIAPVAEVLPEEVAAVVEPPAAVTLQFGQEGIGPGHFNDTRHIAVDGEGRIYTADYDDGRIQQFDPQGNFLATWKAGFDYIDQIAATRQGELYIKGSPTSISIFTSSGQEVRTVDIGQHSDLFTLAPDGSLVVYQGSPNDELIYYNSDLTVRQTISGLLKNVDEDLWFFGIDDVAIDGAGNIFAMTREEVLRFNPEGKFQGRVAVSSEEPGSPTEPDLLFNAQAIAVDGRGRLYVADWQGIKIYGPNDRHLETIYYPENTTLPFDLVITDRGEIFAMDRNGSQVLKFELNE